MSSTTTDDNNNHPLGSSKEITLSKKECTSSEQNNVDTITEDLNSVAILGDTSTCASCGKEGNSDDMNICNKCKMVKYCNAACKKKHRKKHKKACEKRMAELHEEQLFKDIEPEECPICFQPLPIHIDQTTFKSCCGKVVCNGCIYAMAMSEGKDLCAFCRMPPPTSEEEIERLKKLMGKDNAEAFSNGGHFAEGSYGLSQDYRRANELWLKAGELDCAGGYYNLGCSYRLGDGVEVDQKKAKYYFELAAMHGHIKARHNLGCSESEKQAGNLHRAIKHMIMAAKAGDEVSLNTVKHCFMQGIVKKDEYANALRAHQQRKDEMKSDARDKAAEPQNQVLFG